MIHVRCYEANCTSHICILHTILDGVAEIDHTSCVEKHWVSRFCIILLRNFLCHISIQVPTFTMAAVSKKRYLSDASSNTCKRLRKDDKEGTAQVQDYTSMNPIEMLNKYMKEQSSRMIQNISHNDNHEVDEMLSELTQLVETKTSSPHYKKNITHKRNNKNSMVHPKRSSKKPGVSCKLALMNSRPKQSAPPALKSSQSSKAPIWRPFQHILDYEHIAIPHTTYNPQYTSYNTLPSLRSAVPRVVYPTQYLYPTYMFGMQLGNNHVNK